MSLAFAAIVVSEKMLSNQIHKRVQACHLWPCITNVIGVVRHADHTYGDTVTAKSAENILIFGYTYFCRTPKPNVGVTVIFSERGVDHLKTGHVFMSLEALAENVDIPPTTYHLLVRYFTSRLRSMMAPNNLVALAAALREALAAPESLIADSKEEREARLDLIDMIPELNAALIGNANMIRELAWSNVNLAPLHAISRWGLANLVPLDSAISYEELSQKCGISKSILRRMLRHAMTSRLFSEHDGKVSHSPASKLLVEDIRLAAFVDLHTETAWKFYPHMMDALQRWPESRNPREAGYSIAMGCPGEISLFEDVQRDPERRVNFGRAMELFSTGEGYGVTSLVEGYPWEKVGGGTVVDVGGANGFASAAIKKSFPSLRLIVQDIEMSEAMKVDNAEANLEWMAYDFFTPQTVVADIYFYRFVFHNYSDEKAVDILKAAVPALKPGAKILINDTNLPDPGEVRWFDERAARGLDVLMLGVMNGRERNKDDWEALFKAADPHYKFLGATLPPRSRLWLIEAEWME